jgi:hypothetical protein
MQRENQSVQVEVMISFVPLIVLTHLLMICFFSLDRL